MMNTPTDGSPPVVEHDVWNDDGESDDEQHGFADYTCEELLDQAQSNAQAAIMATARFLHDRGIPLGEWARSLGETFSLAWDEPRAWEAGEFMDAMLTNLRALGADVVSAELGLDRAEAVIEGFPDPMLSAMFKVDPALTAEFNHATDVIAVARGIDWTWALDGDQVRLTATVAAPVGGS